MKQLIRQWVILLACFSILLLTGCGTSSNNGVYSDYGYPRYGYGYGCCYYDNDNYYDDRRERAQERRERAQERRERVRERRETTNLTRPSPMGGGMGRPARISRGGGGRGGRGGGGRGR